MTDPGPIPQVAGPTPDRRLAPRPLALHLATAMNGWTSSRAALPLLRNGSLAWRPEVAAAAQSLRAALDAANPRAANPQPEQPESPNHGRANRAAPAEDPFERAVEAEIARRLAALASGIRAYRDHPYRRTLLDPPTLWQDGTTRLLDYGATAPARRARNAAGGKAVPARPVLFVPSLVNRAYILDLSAKRSLLRWLARERPGGTALRPLLVDWDAPGETERGFDLTAYIDGRLGDALTAARALDPLDRPVPVVGYCMGGLLAMALALRRPDDVAALGLLATPWDFHAERAAAAHAAAAACRAATPVLAALGELPVDALQSLFATLDPFLVPRKFAAFAALDPASDKAANFVALEDWLNDGVGLAAAVARECIEGWYGDNAPHRGHWRVGGMAIDPARWTKPALALIPQQDRIVPPASAQALADALPHAIALSPRLGHIGMVAGAAARDTVWRPLADWLGGL
jgi:polyhydroxyalkanoate synthase